MKKLILTAPLLFIVLATALHANAQVGGDGSSYVGRPRYDAARYTGENAGVKINKAMAAAVLTGGVVYVPASIGNIATRVIVESGTRLEFGTGTFTFSVPSYTGATPTVASYGWQIEMKNNSQVVGQGMRETILRESTAGLTGGLRQYSVIGAYNHKPGGGDENFTGVSTGFYIADLQITEAIGSTWFNSAQSTLSLGNLHDSVIERVRLYKTHTLGITLGGIGSSLDRSKESNNVIVQNCEFDSVASQNLNVVNGDNIQFINNRFVRGGYPSGSASNWTFIDLETNTPEDQLNNIIVAGNIFDNRFPLRYDTSTTVSSVNTATDIFAAAGVSIINGTSVRLTSTGTLPAPLVSGTTYYAVSTDYGATTKVAASFANAVARIPVTIDLTTTGTGTVTLTANGANIVGHAISVSNASDAVQGNIVIANNAIYGGNSDSTYDGAITNNMPSGIFLSDVHDIVITGNIIQRTGQSAIQSYESSRLSITNNIFRHVAGGGNVAIIFNNTFYSLVSGNTQTDGNQGGTVQTGGIGAVETGASNYNRFINNIGMPLLVKTGAQTVDVGNTPWR
ncbi:MAG: right-handed parallel beta-helix repeat-containing protein [Pyrinomonadaceae bacterium]